MEQIQNYRISPKLLKDLEENTISIGQSIEKVRRNKIHLLIFSAISSGVLFAYLTNGGNSFLNAGILTFFTITGFGLFLYQSRREKFLASENSSIKEFVENGKVLNQEYREQLSKQLNESQETHPSDILRTTFHYPLVANPDWGTYDFGDIEDIVVSSDDISMRVRGAVAGLRVNPEDLVTRRYVAGRRKSKSQESKKQPSTRFTPKESDT